VNSLVVSNYTPEAASELPVIGVYYTFNIFQVAFALSGSVLVLKLHFRGHKLNRVPNWALKLFRIKSEKLFRERSNSSILNFKNKVLPNSLYSLDVNNKYHYRSHNIINQNALLISAYNNNNNNNIPKSDDKQNKKDNQLHKLIKLLKNNFRKYDVEKIKLKNIEELQLEWKELARRLDYVLLIIAFLSIVSAPAVLFNKYFIRVIEPLKDRIFCSCEHSFI
jgi:hypothetical protein